MKVKSYSINDNPIPGICKQSSEWATDGSNGVWPLVYLQRPKWIKDDAAWARIVASVRLELPSGFEVN